MPQALRWPPTEHDDDGARAQVAAIQAWITRDALPDLPPEHRGLAADPFGVWLRLAPLGGWRELMLSQHVASGLGAWATWIEADGRPGAAFLPPGVAWALSPVLLDLMRRLPGDAIELRYALAGTRPLLPRGMWVHPDGWWDEWKSRPLDEGGATLGEVYRRWLYPRVLSLMERMEGPLGRVVDVCAGDGELGAAVQAAWPAARLRLIERNAVACEAARARCGDGVVQADAADPAVWTGEHDLALLVGAVQGNVMTAGAAIDVMRGVRRSLRPGGYAIVTGWSPCLLDRAGFEALGFAVLNMAVPPGDADPNPRQLYVLQVPGPG